MSSKIERVTLLQQAAQNPALQLALKEKCKRDIIYWFNNFCWTFDPRPGKGKLPFNLFPFQEDFVKSLVKSITEGEDLGVEKSRDMGATWLIIGVFIHFWLFFPDKKFKIGSKKEDDVDTLGEISSIFEKARFYLRTLPHWMIPDKYDEKKNATYLKLINPENRNSITGESSNPNFSRSGRFTAILFDEFAFWPFSDAAWTSAGDSTPCRIPASTPYGKGNKNGKLMAGRNLDERIKKKLTLHWSLHPEKTQEWYEKQKERRTADEMARELDISYEMSVRGTVFQKEFKTHAHVINGSYQWKPYCKNIAAFDFGTTCSVLMGQIDEYDTLHLGKEIILYQNGNTEDIAEAFNTYTNELNLERPWDITCDPAGKARQGKEREETTHIQILNTLGIYPDYSNIQKMQDRLKEGIQLMKRMLSGRTQGVERIQIYEEGCPTLIEAFQSEYRYKTDANNEPLDIIHEEHPWEDIMDCLRYIVIHKFQVQQIRNVPKATSYTQNRNRYTGYRR